jgi:periplasmic divalent cation tolerance protein
MSPDIASSSASARIALTTVGSVEEGRRLARLLVERRLAACVNLIPNVVSVYRWQGAVEEAAAVLLVIKTAADRLPKLEAAVREMHSTRFPSSSFWKSNQPATPIWTGFSARLETDGSRIR